MQPEPDTHEQAMQRWRAIRDAMAAGQDRPGRFDRFAERASEVVSRAWFFAACVGLVVAWAPSILVIRSVDTWQLIINTATTIVTFLLVALLQCAQRRAEQAAHRKLDAIAAGVDALIDGAAHEAAAGGDVRSANRLATARRELRDVIGCEQTEGGDGDG